MKTKQPLVVGLVLDDTLDTPDGVQQYVLTIGRWLTAQGHEVHYLVGRSSRTDVANVHSLARNVRVSFNGNKLSIPLPANTRRLKELMAQHQFDVLHVQTPYSPFLAGKLVRLASPQTAVIGSFHVMPYNRTVSFANRLLAIANRRTGQRFDGMLANSQPSLDFARQVYRFSPKLLPNPFPLQQFLVNRSPKREIPTILFLGRLVERKGARQLLKAVAQLRTNHLSREPFQVLIGGKGPQLAELERYIAQERLGHLVRCVGFVPEEAKRDFLAQADIAVFPSLNGESFGISLLEGLAASRGVVLGGDNPGYRAVLSGLSTEQLVNPVNTDAFAVTLARWLNDPVARRQARVAQRAYAKQFDIDVIGKELMKIYSEALRERRNMR